MIIHDCSQGAGEWLQLRLGIPTASRFGDLMTPTGKRRTGATPQKYLAELAYARITGEHPSHFESKAMEQGTELEPEARAWYSVGHEIRRVGFVAEDNGRWGASPDGLVGEDGGLEIKCPWEANFCRYLMFNDPVYEPYYMQMQGCMWVCERKWWDFVLFTKARNLAPYTCRVERDDGLCAAFDEHMPEICADLDEAVTTMMNTLGMDGEQAAAQRAALEEAEHATYGMPDW